MARKKRYQWDVTTDGDEESKPSRSQKKRDSTALQELGEELVKLPVARLKHLPLSPDLDEALRLMARLTDREGRRRQLQYIGKLMRECDASEVHAALENLRQGQVQDNAAFHHAERLRDALLTAPAAELTRLIQPLLASASSMQAEDELRALVLRAKDETGPPHAKRDLFRRVRELLAAAHDAQADGAETED